MPFLWVLGQRSNSLMVHKVYCGPNLLWSEAYLHTTLPDLSTIFPQCLITMLAPTQGQSLTHPSYPLPVSTYLHYPLFFLVAFLKMSILTSIALRWSSWQHLLLLQFTFLCVIFWSLCILYWILNILESLMCWVTLYPRPYTVPYPKETVCKLLLKNSIYLNLYYSNWR